MSLSPRRSLFNVDILMSTLLFAGIVIYAISTVGLWRVPFEDAAILMRYADNLAHGHGIVWNVGEHPVDGATDFLFMIVVASLVQLGVTVGRAIRIIGIGSHIALTLLIYQGNRWIWKSSVLPALFSALYLAAGTGLSYTFAFFGTSFFALSASLTWLFVLLLMQSEAPSRWLSVAFALSSLITGLVRPEGVIASVLMLLAIIFLKGVRASRIIIADFVAVFLALGGAYFVWHWAYFGYPLPNPFYRKQNLLLGSDSLYVSLVGLYRFCAPFLLAFLLALRSRRTGRMALAFLIPVLGFASAFALISGEMNFGLRYQYPLLPMVLMSWYPLVKGIGAGFRLPSGAMLAPTARNVLLLAAVIFGGCLIYYSNRQNCTLIASQTTCRVANETRGLYDVAVMLSDYSEKGYVLATSEAGLLPYYSRWKAVDTWGLNDSWIIHHGGITEQYLDGYRPEVIVFHSTFSPVLPAALSEDSLQNPWFRMTITLKQYAEQRGYVLAAAFGDGPQDAHYYFVRPDFPDAGRIIRRIRAMDYYWHSLRIPATNYASDAQP
jgi:arabinofuranosyltransferase